MTRTLLLLALLAGLAGCGTYRPAESVYDAGHSCDVLGPNEYSVSFQGTGFARPSDVTESWHQRAKELCGGTDYSGKPEITWVPIRMAFGHPVAVPSAIGKLECMRTVPPSAQTDDKSIQELIQKAESGDATSQHRLGSAYDSGGGLCKSKDEAEKWYRKAAESGNVEAQNSLGSLLQERQKYAEALAWYERAAKHGHALALNNLAYLHDLGLGTKQDRKKAFNLYAASAQLGWAEAMWNIANMYGAGQLGNVDLLTACVWTMRAFDHSKPSERVLRQRIKSVWPALQEKLTPNERTQCESDAKSWQPRR